VASWLISITRGFATANSYSGSEMRCIVLPRFPDRRSTVLLHFPYGRKILSCPSYLGSRGPSIREPGEARPHCPVLLGLLLNRPLKSWWFSVPFSPHDAIASFSPGYVQLRPKLFFPLSPFCGGESRRGSFWTVCFLRLRTCSFPSWSKLGVLSCYSILLP